MSEVNGRFLRTKVCNTVTFDRSGMAINGLNVITMSAGLNTPRYYEEIRSIFGKSNDIISICEKLSKIARYLNEGRQAEAILLATTASWDLPTVSPEDDLTKANFDPSEPRTHGRWSKFGDQYGAQASVEDIQYRGHFHDLVLDDLLQALSKSGSTVLKNISVFGINGVLAIPDGASLPAGEKEPYFIEVKTGFDSEFTANQKIVYRLICLGGHAVSLDSRIRTLGLTPGEPLPSMKIMVVHTYGPGLPIKFHNYCTDFME